MYAFYMYVVVFINIYFIQSLEKNIYLRVKSLIHAISYSLFSSFIYHYLWQHDRLLSREISVSDERLPCWSLISRIWRDSIFLGFIFAISTRKYKKRALNLSILNFIANDPSERRRSDGEAAAE